MVDKREINYAYRKSKLLISNINDTQPFNLPCGHACDTKIYRNYSVVILNTSIRLFGMVFVSCVLIIKIE